MNTEQISNGLRKLGLKEGDIVILHSSLASLGKVDGGAEAVVQAFLDVLGESGTLVVPTFGSLGLITDVVKGHPKAVQSIHPLASVAAIGKDAEEICRDHWKASIAHTENTPYVRTAEKGGYVCLLGVDQDRNTTLHTVEELLRSPYLKTTGEETFSTPEGEVTKSWLFFPGPHRDFIGLDRLLRESGKMKIGRIGDSVVRLIKSQDLIDIALEAGKKDPAFVLCTNSNCPDCVPQRADLRRYAFAKESFTLVASSGLAGRYAEEIADNCRAAGVGAIELDYLRDRPLNMLPPEVVAKAIKTLRDENIKVFSLRSLCLSQDIRSWVRLVLENQVGRLIFPISQRAAADAKTVLESGLSISFFNLGIDSDTCSSILTELKSNGLTVGFTFNGANFARAGELPFLSSYKKKLRRFVDQLDLEDALYEGQAKPLAFGNAEVKEMISILRCASFSGYMVLSAGNRQVGSLLDAAQRLQNLLETM